MASPMPADPMAANRSMLNPTDLAAMKTEGAAGSGTTVRDFLGKMGIDVDGPVDQLTKFANKQLGNASAMGKMKNIAGAAPGGMPGGMQGGPGGGMPPESEGFDGLLKNMGQ